jgi:hypothetical protein
VGWPAPRTVAADRFRHLGQGKLPGWESFSVAGFLSARGWVWYGSARHRGWVCGCAHPDPVTRGSRRSPGFVPTRAWALPSLRGLFYEPIDQLPAGVGGSSRAKPHEVLPHFGEGSIGAFIVDPFGSILSAGVYPLPGSSGLARKRMNSPGERPYGKGVSVG